MLSRVFEVNECLQAGDLQPVTQKSELILVGGRIVELVGLLLVSAVILKGEVEEVVASLLQGLLRCIAAEYLHRLFETVHIVIIDVDVLLLLAAEHLRHFG